MERKKIPLRQFTIEEAGELKRISRSQVASSSHVTHAKILLAVHEGHSHCEAAVIAGRRSRNAVTGLVKRFNKEGIRAIHIHHGGGNPVIYNAVQKGQIVGLVKIKPDRKKDGTSNWSLTTLKSSLRKQGLKTVSTYTIWKCLHEAGLTWQQSRTWVETGSTQRIRKSGIVKVKDIDTEAKKSLIEEAYMLGKKLGLDVWCEDEAGPFQAIPQHGPSWQPEITPKCLPHEYVRGGTAKLLTLLHPADGRTVVKGIESCTNQVLHPWLKKEFEKILKSTPIPKSHISKKENRKIWEHWQKGLQIKFALHTKLPRLRGLLVWDNLAGHKTPDMVNWLVTHGVMPLYTPLSGSWLNMAESIQNIFKRRALNGEHPENSKQIISWLEEVAYAWNKQPTPFIWGGKRATRRQRSYQRHHTQAGSGALTWGPIKKQMLTTAHKRDN